MRVINDILSIIFPRTCHVCHEKLNSQEKFICQHCIDDLPRTLYHRRQLNPMEERFAGKIPFERATGFIFYERSSKYASIIHDFKYRGYSHLATYIGELMAKELYTIGFFDDIDCIVPVPLHKFKEAKRGYNQSLKIAEGVANIIEKEIINNIKLTKWRPTQTLKNSIERWLNTQNSYAIIDNKLFDNKHILIIDDVCTTGATLKDIAEIILKTNPTSRVSLLSFAVTA